MSWAAAILSLSLSGCAPVLVVVERPGCSSERSVTVTRTAGEPTQTVIKAHRQCGPAPELEAR